MSAQQRGSGAIFTFRPLSVSTLPDSLEARKNATLPFITFSNELYNIITHCVHRRKFGLWLGLIGRHGQQDPPFSTGCLVPDADTLKTSLRTRPFYKYKKDLKTG